jgi:hypothetical protein
MKLWLDSNISLDLSREAIQLVADALRNYPYDNEAYELANAANIIRAHLQHVLTEPGLELTDRELLS